MTLDWVERTSPSFAQDPVRSGRVRSACAGDRDCLWRMDSGICLMHSDDGKAVSSGFMQIRTSGVGGGEHSREDAAA